MFLVFFLFFYTTKIQKIFKISQVLPNFSSSSLNKSIAIVNLFVRQGPMPNKKRKVFSFKLSKFENQSLGFGLNKKDFFRFALLCFRFIRIRKIIIRKRIFSFSFATTFALLCFQCILMIMRRSMPWFRNCNKPVQICIRSMMLQLQK